MNVFYVVTEDPLSEAVAVKILNEFHALDDSCVTLLRKGGCGYLKSKIGSWIQIAQYAKVFLLTDLDSMECPVKLIDSWVGNETIPQNLIFRIAVREVEAWLLADEEASKSLLGSHLKCPPCLDELDDPKRYLLNAAKRAKKLVKEELVRVEGANVYQGIGYNNLLSDWVHNEWCPSRAALRSQSLFRAMKALELNM